MRKLKSRKACEASIKTGIFVSSRGIGEKAAIQSEEDELFVEACEFVVNQGELQHQAYKEDLELDIIEQHA